MDATTQVKAYLSKRVEAGPAPDAIESFAPPSDDPRGSAVALYRFVPEGAAQPWAEPFADIQTVRERVARWAAGEYDGLAL